MHYLQGEIPKYIDFSFEVILQPDRDTIIKLHYFQGFRKPCYSFYFLSSEVVAK